MKRFSEQFKKKSDSIRLRASERNDLRDRLTAYMEYHPLPAELKTPKRASASKQVTGIVSEPFKAISLNMTYVRSFAGVFAVFMVIGVPIIAEKAVPGDMLYSVKTNITEEVRASLTLSPYAKVEWETTRLERRVAEARLLANEGKLTPETEAEVAEAVQEHTDAAQEGIASIREENEDDAAMAEIAFASALSVQSEVLEGHVENDADAQDGHSIAALADVVEVASNEADVAQADAAPSYEVLLGKVESETTRAYELFESVKQAAGEKEILNIERRLDDIGRKLNEAIALHTNEPTAPVEENNTEEEIPEEEAAVEEVSVGAPAEETAPESIPEDIEILTPEDEAVDYVAKEIVVPVEEEIAFTDEQRVAGSIELLRVALTDVQKLIIFMTDIDVRENVTIEELVPVTLTNEERTTAILNQLDEVLLIQADIELRILTDDVAEKVSVGSELLVGQLESLTQMLETGDIDAAERVIIEAQAMAQDLQQLVAELPQVGLAEEVETEALGEEVLEEKIVEEEVEELPEEIVEALDPEGMPIEDTEEIAE